MKAEMSLRGRFSQSIHSMKMPLAFPEKKFKATASVRQITGTLFGGGGCVLVDILIVVTL